MDMQSLREAVENELHRPIPARTTMVLESVVIPFQQGDPIKRATWQNLQEDARISRVSVAVTGVPAQGPQVRFISTGCGFQPVSSAGVNAQRMFDFRWDMSLGTRNANTTLRTTKEPWGMSSGIFQSSPTGQFWELRPELDVIQGDSLTFSAIPSCWNPMDGETFTDVTLAFTLHGWREKA